MGLAGFDWSSFGPQLDPGLTLQQIVTMRHNTLWRKALTCPNRITNIHGHNLNCTTCDGTGFLYGPSTEQKMLVTSVSLRQQYMTQGRFDAGMAMITALPEVRLSWWDKVTFTETKMRFTEPVIRGTGPSDRLKYDIIDEPDYPGVELLAVSNGQFLVQGTDFNVVDGKLVWVNSPPVGAFYSIAYLIRPTYVILDVNHHSRTLPSYRSKGAEKTQEFPIQAVGKLDFLIGDESLKAAVS